jgi:hypothetical protein
MMLLLIAAITAAACAGINAIRGNGQGWLRPVVALAAGLGHYAATMQPVPSAILAAGLWLWLTQPWGRWYCLGAGERAWSGPPNAWETPIERVADRAFPTQRGLADALAWLISGTVFALPLAVLSSPWWLILTPATIAIYVATQRAFTTGPHVRAGEVCKGGLIGLIAILLVGCAAPQREPDWGGIAREAGKIINR